MHNSTPPKWKRLKSNVLLAAVFAAANPASALDLSGLDLSVFEFDDPHLNTLPRTPEESARIGAVTAPAVDFTAPEPFEKNPAGSATTRARHDDEAFSQHAANLSFEQELEF